MKVKKAVILGVIAAAIAISAVAVKVEEEKKTERMEKGVGAVLSPTSHALTKKYMYEDYDAFWKNAEENYSFWRVAEETTGNNLEELKKEYRKEIEEIENDWQFHDLIIKCIDAFGGVGHMQPMAVENFYYNIAGNVEQEYKEEKDVFYTLSKLNNEKSKTFYQYNEKEEKKVLKELERLNRIPQEEREIKFTYEIFPEKKAAVIEIPSFILNKTEGEPELLALEELFKKLERKGIENCIIDIRENGGGTDKFWMEGIIKPNLKKEVSYTTYFLYKGEEGKKVVELNGKMVPVKRTEIAGLPALNPEDFEDTEYIVKQEMKFKPAQKPWFTGRFFVLTSEKNYSSAESFVRVCKRTGFATTIGTRTSGDGGDGNMPLPMYFVLPNSGICYRFSIFNIINPDGSNNEEFGTEPDIKVENQDILEACFKYLKEF